MDFKESMQAMYAEMVKRYMEQPSENGLYDGQKFSRQSIEHQISPEEIISIHKQILQESGVSGHVINSFDILLEVMMGYGLAYQEHQSLRSKQKELRSELEVAANMQQSLLQSHIPNVKGLDLGVISVPAKQMSGDYYHFIEDGNGALGIAVADIIGKGIPAALCMSMIKYAMDSIPDDRHSPAYILQSLNRVVEQNVDSHMFISMIYGLYNQKMETFLYASAGHEPGFYYHAEEDEFHDLTAKGLLLGVNKRVRYETYSKKLEAGDMIILFSDGVTECRTDDGFLEREDVIHYIRKYFHLPAQELVNHIYKDLEKLQDFELRDDFTLIVMKKEE
ncbi:PP2C family protein-serine/threonine phosphatase [Mangrovibacillus cuniculi]|uniref:PP2C family protein-serine/threonine phosphatase n=1 Tax=Mangrovibacillus cuniculi TaxID=2593652 RepID=A0A7S8CE75_9BACI|nr:PP2C family protein-serine/threonine phosphatase [Mangrovibacillus cuniculi]QPC48193.1 PP2C family protein-serine/threonine phosphatase [Mangrovibacillus cuniculi]